MSKDDLLIGTNAKGGNFFLPLDAVTQTFGILAKRGAGKTNSAVVLAEEMLARRHQVLILDPTDCWHGLRAAADGKHVGHSIYIFGGEHCDVVLTETSGVVLADFVVENRASAVFSLRHLSGGAQRRFVADFCERLYDRKGEGKNRTPLHLFIDEADAYCPQRLFHGAERTYGAVDTIVRRGRSSGIGVTIISQRSAAIAKDVLTQIEVLVALRTISPQDRKAMEAWIEAHDARDQHKEFMESLASLEIGEAWFWSPGWLDIFEKVKVRRRYTFDSSATPKVGQKAIEPKKLAEVDLDALKTKLAATIEKTKADDPRELKKKISELQRELANKKPTETIVTKTIEALPQKELEAVLNSYAKFFTCMTQTKDAMNVVTSALAALKRFKSNHTQNHIVELAHEAIKKIERDNEELPRSGGLRANDPAGIYFPTGGLRRILIALAQRPDGLDRRQLGVRSGLSSRSGTFSTYLGRARSMAWVEKSGDRFRITKAGIQNLGAWEPLPTGEGLYKYWMNELGNSGAARMLHILYCQQRSVILNKEEIGKETGMSANSGTFSTYLGRLRALELVEKTDGGFVVSEELL